MAGTQHSVGEVVATANARPARADIALEAAAQPAGVAVRAQVQVPDVADRKGAIPYVALVDSGLVSDVRAGENAGARLTHDHVVRAFRAGSAVDASGAGGADVVLPWPSEAGHDAAIVAFVQNAQTGDVLQALALPLTEPAHPACVSAGQGRVAAVSVSDRYAQRTTCASSPDLYRAATALSANGLIREPMPAQPNCS